MINRKLSRTARMQCIQCTECPDERALIEGKASFWFRGTEETELGDQMRRPNEETLRKSFLFAW